MFNLAEISRIADAIHAGSNDVVLSGNRGVWLQGGTVSMGISRVFEREAFAQTLAPCRGDAINRLRELNRACQERAPGDPCACL